MTPVKLQTKLAFAFLGSAFVALMIYDRGGQEVLDKEENLDESHDLIETWADHNHRSYESDRVLHRSKRALLAEKLNIIYRQLDSQQECCNAPSLLADMAMDACLNKNRKNKKTVARPAKGTNLFERIAKNFLQPNSRRNAVQKTPSGRVRIVNKGKKQSKNKKTNSRGKRELPGKKILLSSVCFTDCVFSYLGLINDSAMDLAATEKHFKTNLSPEWISILENALYNCEESAACASPEMINVAGRYCSIKPTILMTCVKQRMLSEKCPSSSVRKSGFVCNTGRASLKSLNTKNLIN